MVARAARQRETVAPDWLAMTCHVMCQMMFRDVLKGGVHTESGGCGGGGGAGLEGRADTSHANSGCWCEKCHKDSGTCEATMRERN